MLYTLLTEYNFDSLLEIQSSFNRRGVKITDYIYVLNKTKLTAEKKNKL